MIRARIKTALETVWERRYRKELSKKKITYDEWIKCRELPAQEETETDLHAETDPAAFFGCTETAEAVIFYAGDGRPSKNMKGSVASFFREHPQIVLAYGDEDVQDRASGERRSPWYKPDWSPDTFCSYFYWGSVCAVRRTWLETVLNPEEARKAPLLSPMDFYHWLERLIEKAGGFAPDCNSIGHIPEILFHDSAESAQIRFQQYGGADPGKPKQSLVSVIIPSKDNPGLLRQCIQSLSACAKDVPWELVVVDNGSTAENRRQIQDFLQTVPVRHIYLYQPMEFNFSRMCNLGAKKAAGDMLLFLNDDVEMCCEDCLRKMAEKASLPYVGAVGIKLYYPDSRKIQHDGITNLPMGPVHKLQYLEDNENYYYGRNLFDWNVIAVTGACLMCGRERFLKAQGFCEELKVAFNDVAFGFQLRRLGFYNVVLNKVFAYHHESLSRGSDNASAEKTMRLQAEWRKLYELYPDMAEKDPYYPEGLNRDSSDTKIRLAYITAGNRPQAFMPKVMKPYHPKLRRDDCLMVGMEQTEADKLQGYSVVLGDNNACYEKELLLLLLKKNGETEENPEETDPFGTMPAKEITPEILRREKPVVYVQPLVGQYRFDLEENLPDQRNVELGGFWIEESSKHGTARNGFGDGLPKGAYRLGILARNRISGLELFNWSNRIWHKE